MVFARHRGIDGLGSLPLKVYFSLFCNVVVWLRYRVSEILVFSIICREFFCGTSPCCLLVIQEAMQGAVMISHSTTPITKTQESVALLQSRMAPNLEHRVTGRQSARVISKDHTPAEMSMLQHLLCGGMGVSFIILFMGMINVMVNTLIDRTFSFSVNDLLWMIGQ